MICVHLPSFETPDQALDWLEAQGHEIVCVCLMRGNDGMVRGTALLKRRRPA